MSDKNIAGLVSEAAAKTSTSMLMFEGAVLIVLGTLAILLPFVFTMAIEQLIGILLVVGGLIRGYSAFKAPSARSVVWNVLAAVVAIAAGVLMLVYPLGGALTLTAIVIALLMVEGVTKILAAFQLKAGGGKGWVLFAGVMDVALGLILWFALPEGSYLWAIGLLVGISLLFTGWTAVMLAAAMRRAAKDDSASST